MGRISHGLINCHDGGGRAKSMCFEAKGRLQGRASKLLRARRRSRCNAGLGQICLAANGRRYSKLPTSLSLEWVFAKSR